MWSRSPVTVLAGTLALAVAAGPAASAPPAWNTAPYAPGSLGYFSVPVYRYVPDYFYNPYDEFGVTGVVYPYYPPALDYNAYPGTNSGNPPYSTGYSPALGPTGWGTSPTFSTSDLTPPIAAPPPKSDVAGIALQVPPRAEVWIEGVRSKQKGSVREFVSPSLDPNIVYAYEIRAAWRNNGEAVSEVQRINVRAGDRMKLIFQAGSPIRINPDKRLLVIDEDEEEGP